MRFVKLAVRFDGFLLFFCIVFGVMFLLILLAQEIGG